MCVYIYICMYVRAYVRLYVSMYNMYIVIVYILVFQNVVPTVPCVTKVAAPPAFMDSSYKTKDVNVSICAINK